VQVVYSIAATLGFVVALVGGVINEYHRAV
jgi:hypothetical protein